MGLFKYEVVTTPLVFPHGTGVLVILPVAAKCRGCGEEVRIVVNRLGETKCTSCDPGEPALQTSAASAK